MSGLGHLAPLPLRCGRHSIASDELNRLAADVAGVTRQVPLARLHVDGSSHTITTIRSRATTELAPTVEAGAAGYAATLGAGTQLTFPSTWVDDDGRTHQLALTRAQATGHGTTAGRTLAVLGADPTSSRFVYVAHPGVDFTLTVYADIKADAYDYGFHPDKRDSLREPIPYAAGWLRIWEATRGGAYSRDPASNVGIRNRAYARFYAWVSRATERLYSNASPLTATNLGYWAALFALPTGGNEWALRDRVAARYAAGQGAVREGLDSALRVLLRTAFVATRRLARNDSEVDSTAAPHHWASGDPGPAAIALDDKGAWTSALSHLTAEVQRIAGMSDQDWRALLDRDLTDLLDGALPASSTFGWSTNPDGQGFRLDVSPLDEVGLS